MSNPIIEFATFFSLDLCRDPKTNDLVARCGIHSMTTAELSARPSYLAFLDGLAGTYRNEDDAEMNWRSEIAYNEQYFDAMKARRNGADLLILENMLPQSFDLYDVFYVMGGMSLQHPYGVFSPRDSLEKKTI